MCHPFAERSCLTRVNGMVVISFAVAIVYTAYELLLPSFIDLGLSTLYAGALLHCLLPFVAITVFSLLVLRQIRLADQQWAKQRQRSHDPRKVTAILLLICLIFLACHLPFVVRNLCILAQVGGLSSQDVLKPWIKWSGEVAHVTIVLNSACNFVIYATRDARFRDAITSSIRSVCCCCCKRKATQVPATRSPSRKQADGTTREKPV